MLRFRRFSLFAIVVSMLLAGGVAQARSQTQAPPLPEIMRPSELPEDYKAWRLELSGTTQTERVTELTSLHMIVNGHVSRSPETGFGALLFGNVYWYPSAGSAYAGQGRILAYRLEYDLLSDRRPGSEPDADTYLLRLCTINTDYIMVSSALPELTKAKLLAILGGGRSSQSAQDSANLSAKRTATLSNIKQTGTALMIYGADYDDLFPYAQSTAAVQYVTHPYMKNIELWKTLNPNGGRILFNMALGGTSGYELNDPTNTVMLYESKAWPDGRRAVCFADSSCRFVDEEQWKELSKTLKLKLRKHGKPLPANWGVEWAKKNGLG